MAWRERGRVCRYGDGDDPEQAALIGEMEARVSRLEKTLRYDTANSRRGMPSLYDKEVKKFDKDMAELCGRPMRRRAAALPWAIPAPRTA